MGLELLSLSESPEEAGLSAVARLPPDPATVPLRPRLYCGFFTTIDCHKPLLLSFAFVGVFCHSSRRNE